jgi:hypothetical protein
VINFSEISSKLAASDYIRNARQALKDIDAEVFFSIACDKDRIFREKVRQLKIKKVYVVKNNTNFGNISSCIAGMEINFLTAEDFRNPEHAATLTECLSNSLVIMTSNLFAEIGSSLLGNLYANTPNTLYAIHDYDNHHWLKNNLEAAIFADLYIPSHQSDFLLAGRLNTNILGNIPIGSNQWSREFISSRSADLTQIARKNTPLGKYYFYEKFQHRNKAIFTLSKTYPDINIVTSDFHSMSPEQKWTEWTGYKLHWIIPVLNDLPIRFFDALITGGIPLVPFSLKPFISSLGIPDHFYACHGPLDLLDPHAFISSQLEKFDEDGARGILERHALAVKEFHIDPIVEKIISASLERYGQNLASVNRMQSSGR